jgi:L-aminopeptidase/D-esterase-like protein
LQAGANTTLGVVACNADLTTVECKRLAMMAQDGIARAVRPAHTPFDGDTIFALASGEVSLGADQRRTPERRTAERRTAEQRTAEQRTPQQRAAQIGRIGSAAADCVARAIARAAHCGAGDSR